MECREMLSDEEKGQDSGGQCVVGASGVCVRLTKRFWMHTCIPAARGQGNGHRRVDARLALERLQRGGVPVELHVLLHGGPNSVAERARAGDRDQGRCGAAGGTHVPNRLEGNPPRSPVQG
jgi:hypothetical protein